MRVYSIREDGAAGEKPLVRGIPFWLIPHTLFTGAQAPKVRDTIRYHRHVCIG